MSFRKEPPYIHGSQGKTAVVLVNLGTPEAPTTRAVRRYLKQFLSDPRVVEIPRAIWWFILNGIILPFRSSKSAAKYDSIWTRDGSPLKVHTERQTAMLQGQLEARGHQVTVVCAMRYGQPALPDVLDRLKTEGCERILILPAYPQYSATTTASIFDALFCDNFFTSFISLGCERPTGQTGDEFSWRPQAHLAAGRSVSLRVS